MSASDDFFVGWSDATPPASSARTRDFVRVALLGALAVALLAVLGQRRLEPATFEYGVVTTLEGRLATDPVPSLLVPRPGSAGGVSRYPLVRPFKFGAADDVAGLDGRRARLSGSLVHRGGLTMVELVPGSIEVLDDGPGSLPPPSAVDLGTATFVGEIVDSKCFLGVMNPGRLKPHKACAIRCISGGIPPVLLVRDPSGTSTCLVLTDSEGRMVNARVLGMVAEPVEITGRVRRLGELLVLAADPETYRPLSRP